MTVKEAFKKALEEARPGVVAQIERQAGQDFHDLQRDIEALALVTEDTPEARRKARHLEAQIANIAVATSGEIGETVLAGVKRVGGTLLLGLLGL